MHPRRAAHTAAGSASQLAIHPRVLVHIEVYKLRVFGRERERAARAMTKKERKKRIGGEARAERAREREAVAAACPGILGRAPVQSSTRGPPHRFVRNTLSSLPLSLHELSLTVYTT